MKHKFVLNQRTGGMRSFLRSCVLGLGVTVGVGVGFPALAGTITVASPTRALVSYASDTKAIVNVRGLPSSKNNTTPVWLSGHGLLVIFR